MACRMTGTQTDARGAVMTYAMGVVMAGTSRDAAYAAFLRIGSVWVLSVFQSSPPTHR